jgi:hypothetical protein
MKKLFLLAACYCLYVSASAQGVPSKNHPGANEFTGPVLRSAGYDRAQHHFSLTYPNVTDGFWTSSSDGGFICQFRESEVSDQVHYNKRGRWVCTIAGYDAQKLPAAVREAVLTCYEGYRISYVHEINLNAPAPVYFINIETLSKIRIIQVVGDDIVEIRHLDKID